MMRLLSACLLAPLSLAGACQPDPGQPVNTALPAQPTPASAGHLRRLTGTWVQHKAGGSFGVLRIQADSTGEYAFYDDPAAHRALTDTVRYSTSEGPLRVHYRPRVASGIRYIPNLEVKIDMLDAVFDYELRGDTLLEYDKMGLQGRWIREHPTPPY